MPDVVLDRQADSVAEGGWRFPSAPGYSLNISLCEVDRAGGVMAGEMLPDFGFRKGAALALSTSGHRGFGLCGWESGECKGNPCQSGAICGELWRVMANYGELWKAMETLSRSDALQLGVGTMVSRVCSATPAIPASNKINAQRFGYVVSQAILWRLSNDCQAKSDEQVRHVYP